MLRVAVSPHRRNVVPRSPLVCCGRAAACSLYARGRALTHAALPSAQQRSVPVDVRPPASSRLCSFEYRYLTEFQSHEPEFDYLKSLEIEEKVNAVRWVRASNGCRMLLSTNDKTIKLWKAWRARRRSLLRHRGAAPPHAHDRACHCCTCTRARCVHVRTARQARAHAACGNHARRVL